ncbi:NUDIX domain-containing protein [Cryobacterium sp.]|jgi:ADP-ribose pyrophosphatase YjhB (NUDIX family)|uniref:NUDIX hydrolase n=1 Tax=Cryobacterium sp. TaxID=1926290 RepID=UPI002604320A|nr:NUDIX domain-containing protein [Cryobacterium sp.]MCU1444950.1 pyrophosphohydrolase [Cryobacterium sp.]
MTTAALPAPAADLVTRLRQWLPLGPEQAALRDEYLSFVGGSPHTALARDGGPEHVTGSCFVFTPDLARVLLCFHKKGRFWVQLGGHVEPVDGSVAEAAYREAREECGIDDLSPIGALLDVDRHGLGGGFRCSVHWDVGFAAIARPEAAPVASAESEDVAWWPVAALPENVPPQFGRRLAGVLAELAHQRA